jgi:hypothetical protein
MQTPTEHTPDSLGEMEKRCNQCVLEGNIGNCDKWNCVNHFDESKLVVDEFSQGYLRGYSDAKDEIYEALLKELPKEKDTVITGRDANSVAIGFNYGILQARKAIEKVFTGVNH